MRRHISEDRLEEDMEDIAGLRIMCQFVEDIYQVVDLLRKRTDINILEERDYVHNKSRVDIVRTILSLNTRFKCYPVRRSFWQKFKSEHWR